LPESWNGNGAQYNYATCLPMPVSSEVCSKLNDQNNHLLFGLKVLVKKVYL